MAGMGDDDSDAPEGFDEIENMFSQVSLVADALLDSINDDNVKAKEKKSERKSSIKRSIIEPGPIKPKRKPTARFTSNYVTDSEDEVMRDDDVVHHHTQSYYNKPEEEEFPDESNNSSFGHESDVSTLGDMTFGAGDDESVDGSLVHDVVNLKANMKAMQAEMRKQEEAFHANVTDGCNGQTFFQKLEDSKAVEDARAVEESKTPKVKNKFPPRTSGAPLTISIKNKKEKGPPVLMSSAKKQQGPPFGEQLQQFCDQLLGTEPNLPLLAASLVVWLFVFRAVYMAASNNLIDGEGYLRF